MKRESARLGHGSDDDPEYGAQTDSDTLKLLALNVEGHWHIASAKARGGQGMFEDN